VVSTTISLAFEFDLSNAIIKFKINLKLKVNADASVSDDTFKVNLSV